MPLFMDIHKKVDGATAEAVAGAHARDLEVGDKVWGPLSKILARRKKRDDLLPGRGA